MSLCKIKYQKNRYVVCTHFPLKSNKAKLEYSVINAYEIGRTRDNTKARGQENPNREIQHFLLRKTKRYSAKHSAGCLQKFLPLQVGRFSPTPISLQWTDRSINKIKCSGNKKNCVRYCCKLNNIRGIQELCVSKDIENQLKVNRIRMVFLLCVEKHTFQCILLIIIYGL